MRGSSEAPPRSQDGNKTSQITTFSAHKILEKSSPWQAGVPALARGTYGFCMKKFMWRDQAGDQRPYYLSEVEERFVCCIGLEKAIDLFRHFGGANLNLYENPRNSRLLQILGKEACEKLFCELGGGCLGRLPLANEFLTKYYATNGVSGQEIARVLRVNCETVRRHLLPDRTRLASLKKSARSMKRFAEDLEAL